MGEKCAGKNARKSAGFERGKWMVDWERDWCGTERSGFSFAFASGKTKDRENAVRNVPSLPWLGFLSSHVAIGPIQFTVTGRLGGKNKWKKWSGGQRAPAGEKKEEAGMLLVSEGDRAASWCRGSNGLSGAEEVGMAIGFELLMNWMSTVGNGMGLS